MSQEQNANDDSLPSSERSLILLIDDEASVHDDFLRALKLSKIADPSISMRVEFLKSGKAGAAVATEIKPDLCVIDWDFSESDCAEGETVADEIGERIPSLPLLLFSKYDTPEEAADRSLEESSIKANKYYMSKSTAFVGTDSNGLKPIIGKIVDVLRTPNRIWPH